MRSVRIATAAGIVAAGLVFGATGIAQAATPTAVPAPSPNTVTAYPTAGYVAPKVAIREKVATRQEMAVPEKVATRQRAGIGKQRGVRALYRVTASRLNVRSGPGTGYHVVGSLPRGARVAANTATVNGFREISAGRWVSVRYLGATG